MITCYPELQDSNGWAVAMLLARHATADVQRVWLEKWTPADCCPLMQTAKGWTVAMFLARYASADVQKLWLER